MVGIPGMHRVPHLMDQSKNIVQRIRIIEQHVRVHAVNARRIRSRPLSHILIHVDPALLICLSHDRKVFFTERRQCLQRDCLGLLIGKFPVIPGDDRHIYVIHVQFIHAQHLPAQGNIAVHVRYFAADAVDQAVADGRIHIVTVDGGLKRGRILPCACVKNLLLHLSVIQRCPGILELAVPRVVFLKRSLAQCSVRRHLQRHEAAVRELDLAAAGIGDRREFQVRVGEHAEAVRCGHCHFTRRGQKRFHLLPQRVVSAPSDLPDRHFIIPKPRLLLIKPCDRIVPDHQDLRLQKGQFFADPDRGALRLQLHPLIAGIACILVAAHEGITAHAVEL